MSKEYRITDLNVSKLLAMPVEELRARMRQAEEEAQKEQPCDDCEEMAVCRPYKYELGVYVCENCHETRMDDDGYRGDRI